MIKNKIILLVYLLPFGGLFFFSCNQNEKTEIEVETKLFKENTTAHITNLADSIHPDISPHQYSESNNDITHYNKYKSRKSNTDSNGRPAYTRKRNVDESTTFEKHKGEIVTSQHSDSMIVGQEEDMDRSQLIVSKNITLDKLKYMAFVYVKINGDNIKSIKEIYDSGYIDKLNYEQTKLNIEKNIRIIRLLNQVALDKSNDDQKFIKIYLEQLVSIIKDGLVVSQGVLQYLQSIYDMQKISQQRYIASADNLKVNVNLMWDIINQIDF